MRKRPLTKGKGISFRPSEANRAFLQEGRSKGLTTTAVVEAGLDLLRKASGSPVIYALSKEQIERGETDLPSQEAQDYTGFDSPDGRVGV